MNVDIAYKAQKLFNGKGLRTQLLRGGIGSIGVKSANVILGLLLTVVLARTLGPSDFGIYAFVLALIMLMALPAQVGLPQLVVRETAKADALESWGLMRGVWRWANFYVAIFSVLMMGLGIIVLWFQGDWLGDARRNTLTMGLVLVPLIALGRIRGAALRGLRKVVLGQLPERVLRPAFTLILAIAIFWALGYDATPATVMGLHALGALIAFFIGAAMLIRSRPIHLKERPKPVYQSMYWRKAAMPLAMLAGLQLINSQTDILMLGVLREDAEVGVYRVVVQIATLVIFGLQAIDQVLQPYFASLHAKGDMVQLQKLITLSARVALILALPPVVVVTIWGEPLLSLLFGEEYRIGSQALIILASGQLVNAAMGSVGMILNATGHERDTVRGVALAAIFNVLLNLTLIPTFGLNGAAIANVTSLIVWNLILRHYVRQRLAIESSAFFLKKSRHSF